MAAADRYRTDAYAVVKVRCGCGHFDTVSVQAGAFIVVDGTYEKCAVCQEYRDDDAEGLQDRSEGLGAEPHHHQHGGTDVFDNCCQPVEHATVTVRRDDLAYAAEWAARNLPSFGQHDRLDRLMYALENRP